MTLKIEEPPYASVPGAAAGSLAPEDSTEGTYEVRWLEGTARERVWKELGIHESFGSYRSEGAHPTDWWWSRLLDRIRSRQR